MNNVSVFPIFLWFVLLLAVLATVWKFGYEDGRKSVLPPPDRRAQRDSYNEYEGSDNGRVVAFRAGGKFSKRV